MIYAFGDSHSREASQVPGVTVAFAGPITLHRFGRPGEAVNLLSPWKEATGIFLLIGEIDVRCHVGKLEQRPTDTLFALAQGASLAVDALKAEFEIEAVFCAVTPPSVAHDSSPEFPIVGSLSERAHWTNILNTMLSERVPFYDPYELFRDIDGTLPIHFSDGSVHLHPRYGPQAFGPLVERMVSV